MPIDKQFNMKEMNGELLDEDFEQAYQDLNKALTDMDWNTEDSFIEKLIQEMDRKVLELEKYLNNNYTWNEVYN